MRLYDIVVLVTPDLTDEDAAKVAGEYRKILTDGGAEIWWRCARHLVHPTFIPLVLAAGLPPTCEVEVGNVPCGAMSTHVSLFRDWVDTTTECLELVSACTRHAVRTW